MSETVLVCGAGMVGVTIALELQKRGFTVTLLDRKEPGMETSHGNAGIITRTSLVPINNPTLWGQLPKLMLNRSTSMRYNPAYMLRNSRWGLSFLSNARKSKFEETTQALFELIELSRAEHERLHIEAGAENLVRDDGWIFLYRSEADFQNAAFTRKVYASFGVETQLLEPAEIAALEPGLKPIFAKGVWIKDTRSVQTPTALVQAYANLFTQRGGTIEQWDLATLDRGGAGWQAKDSAGNSRFADKVVIALGPWSKAFLKRLGYDVPMGFERGYHMLYSAPNGMDTALSRPFYDVSSGYVMAPMDGKLRLCTGVELAELDAPKNFTQLESAEKSARQAVDLGDRLLEEAWMGSRPTMPDCRPVIGPAPGQDNLYFAFGHQHIGFNTGPGTAKILADQIQGREKNKLADPFKPERFILPNR